MKISNTSINNGLFLGLILIIFSVALSYANPTLFIQSKSFLLSVPFVLILIKAASEFRKESDGYARFGQLFNITFFCAAIAVVICTLFEFILFNYIQTDLIEVERSLSLEALEKTRDLLGEEYVTKNKKLIESAELHSIGQTFGYLLTRMVFPAGLFSSFVSLIFQRKRNQISKL